MGWWVDNLNLLTLLRYIKMTLPHMFVWMMLSSTYVFINITDLCLLSLWPSFIYITWYQRWGFGNYLFIFVWHFFNNIIAPHMLVRSRTPQRNPPQKSAENHLSSPWTILSNHELSAIFGCLHESANNSSTDSHVYIMSQHNNAKTT